MYLAGKRLRSRPAGLAPCCEGPTGPGPRRAPLDRHQGSQPRARELKRVYRYFWRGGRPPSVPYVHEAADDVRRRESSLDEDAAYGASVGAGDAHWLRGAASASYLVCFASFSTLPPAAPAPTTTTSTSTTTTTTTTRSSSTAAAQQQQPPPPPPPPPPTTPAALLYLPFRRGRLLPEFACLHDHAGCLLALQQPAAVI